MPQWVGRPICVCAALAPLRRVYKYMEVWFPSWPWMQGQKSVFFWYQLELSLSLVPILYLSCSNISPDYGTPLLGRDSAVGFGRDSAVGLGRESQRSEVRDQRSEIRGQRSEVRGRGQRGQRSEEKSEVRGVRSHVPAAVSIGRCPGRCAASIGRRPGRSVDRPTSRTQCDDPPTCYVCLTSRTLAGRQVATHESSRATS